MSLMFLLSGLFAWPTWPAKERRSSRGDRVLRLGLPFLVAAGVSHPRLLPAYLQSRRTTASGTNGCTSVLAGRPGVFLWVLWRSASSPPHSPSSLQAGGTLSAGSPAFSNRPSPRSVRCLPSPTRLPVDGGDLRSDVLDELRAVLRDSSADCCTTRFYFFAGTRSARTASGRGLLAADGKVARRWPLWSPRRSRIHRGHGTFVTILATLPKAGPGMALMIFGNFTYVSPAPARRSRHRWSSSASPANRNRAADSLGANAYGTTSITTSASAGCSNALLPQTCRAS